MNGSTGAGSGRLPTNSSGVDQNKSQHELIFDGKANALACAGRSHLCIATVCAEDAVPKDDVTTVVGVRDGAQVHDGNDAAVRWQRTSPILASRSWAGWRG